MTSSNEFQVLALSGSIRRNSYNRGLLEAAAESAPVGMHIRVYDGLSAIPLFNADFEGFPYELPTSVKDLHDKVAAADGLLISTPEYNQSLPGVLKNAIDWLSRPLGDGEVLVDKPVAILGATVGPWGTRLAQAQLRHALFVTESLIMPRPSLFIRNTPDLFNEHGQLLDMKTRQALVALTVAFKNWITVVRNRTITN